MSSVAAISAGLRSAGIDPPTAARLGAYGDLLLEGNRALNLTAARTPDAVIEHLLDALSLRADVVAPLIDVGSGNGLPGIPLAIATGTRVALLEAVAKKARFLEAALAELDLDGEVLSGRAERFGRDPRLREQFGSATARAVASAPAVAELTVPFLRVGGRALLQRGALDGRERTAVEDAAPMLGARVVEERALDGERRLLVLEKVATTQGRFPRRDGVPEKRPLCYDPVSIKP